MLVVRGKFSLAVKFRKPKIRDSIKKCFIAILFIFIKVAPAVAKIFWVRTKFPSPYVKIVAIWYPVMTPCAWLYLYLAYLALSTK